jgi:MutS domain V
MNITIITICALILLTSLGFYLFFEKRKITRKIENIKSLWGKYTDKYRDFDLISSFYKASLKSDNGIYVCERTWGDLDCDEVFSLLDSTNSIIGQQKLYQLLRQQGKSKEELISFDKLVEYFNNSSEKRLKTQICLSKLDDGSFYYFENLFLGKIHKRPKYFIIYPFLSFLSLATLMICFFIPKLIWLFAIVAGVCLTVHYINKSKIGSLIDSFVNIHLVIKALKKIIGINENLDILKQVKKPMARCRKITKLSNWISINNGDGIELMALLYMVIELIKGLFLIDIILFYNALGKIKKEKSSLKILYETLGTIDAAISVASFRKSLVSYCKPVFVEKGAGIVATGIYHPLVADCIANSIEANSRSVLISGSNMAGKSTFVKAIGINAILSQSIYTSMCTHYSSSMFTVFSVINVSDNIMKNKSYYMEEINAIGNLIDASQRERDCLFILDELFKGTNTFDRMAASKSVLSFLSEPPNIVFISTHDVDLADYLKEKFDLYCFEDAIEGNELIFNFKLRNGRPSKSNAIKLLQISNFPDRIIKDAKDFKENESGKFLH